MNPLITRKPKLRRQRKIFRQQGKMPRPEQLNINVATWGRLLKKNNWAKPDLASQDQETKDQDSFAGEYNSLSKFATKVVILSS